MNHRNPGTPIHSLQKSSTEKGWNQKSQSSEICKAKMTHLCTKGTYAQNHKKRRRKKKHQIFWTDELSLYHLPWTKGKLYTEGLKNTMWISLKVTVKHGGSSPAGLGLHLYKYNWWFGQSWGHLPFWEVQAGSYPSYNIFREAPVWSQHHFSVWQSTQTWPKS